MIEFILKIHGSSSGITFDCANERITASGEFFAEEGAIAGFLVSTSSLRHQNGEMLTTDECQELIRQYEEYISKPHAAKNRKLKFE